MPKETLMSTQLVQNNELLIDLNFYMAKKLRLYSKINQSQITDTELDNTAEYNRKFKKRTTITKV